MDDSLEKHSNGSVSPEKDGLEDLDDTITFLEQSLLSVQIDQPFSTIVDQRLTPVSSSNSSLPNTASPSSFSLPSLLQYEFSVEKKKGLQLADNIGLKFTPAAPASPSSSSNPQLQDTASFLAAFVPLTAVAEPLSQFLKATASPASSLTSITTNASSSSIEDIGNPIHGVMILIRLSPILQKRLYTLVRQPSLIVETLLMLGKVQEITKIWEEVTAVRDDNLLCTYARRALSISSHPNVDRPSLEWFERSSIRRSHISFSNSLGQKVNVLEGSDDFLILYDYHGVWDGALTGNKATDSALRDKHFYATSPDVGLAISLLDLCSDRHLVGHVCLDICDALVFRIHKMELADLPLIQHVGEQLLRYASHCYLPTDYEYQLCDTFETGLSLLIILRGRGKCNTTSLLDLANPVQALELCEILVEEDMANAALILANKTGVSPACIWKSWGFKCLRDGEYLEAREKLSEYFAFSEPNSAQLGVLADIVHMLGSPQHHPEAIHYLRTYGTPRILVEWLVEHDHVSEACQFFLEHSLPPSFLIEKIVEPCCRLGILPSLLFALKSADTHYILAVCKHFNDKREYHAMMEFQLLMGDHIRAALTCIKIFLDLNFFDFSAQEKFLLEARGHFVRGIDQKKNKIMNTEDIQKYIQKVDVQLRVVDLFRKSKSPTSSPEPPPFLSVFGNQKQRTDLAVEVLTLCDLELGFYIVSLFKLPPLPIILVAVQEVTSPKHNNANNSNGASNGNGNTNSNMIEMLIERAGSMELTDNEYDEVVLATIRGMAAHGQAKAAESYIAKLRSDSSRVVAFLACGRTATASLLAERIPQAKASFKSFTDVSSQQKMEKS